MGEDYEFFLGVFYVKQAKGARADRSRSRRQELFQNRSHKYRIKVDHVVPFGPLCDRIFL